MHTRKQMSGQVLIRRSINHKQMNGRISNAVAWTARDFESAFVDDKSMTLNPRSGAQAICIFRAICTKQQSFNDLINGHSVLK